MPSSQRELTRAAGAAVDSMVDAWSMASPQIRVRLGATMAASVIFARGRMPAIPAVLAAVGVGVLAERAYVVVHDVHKAAMAIADFAYPLDDDRPLLPDLAAAVRDMLPDEDVQ